MAYSKLQSAALERARSNFKKLDSKRKSNMGPGTATKVSQDAGAFAERRSTEEKFNLRRRKK